MKTVTFDDEAYALLKGLKMGPGDSFSDVVKRHLGNRPRLEDSAGGWKHKSKRDVKRLRDETVRMFGTTLD